ncbi:Golgi apparatus membrane protein TVP23 [Spathaspora passalidarum NRRL Y-27907]|uniref:Golgi apparatus membrane protein TVP23 n=1 Tax=Spathaspora passalidarum (strain NRRL Y-27907 / 11-Y1) TaxID=619300 RepID=G3AMY9_SPAPN|nr:Golgi apparatus membrane protein TVP23 [Spathaspora passalidarum NRRL Y-27907]EGW32403.1 Golgi apparatus membrane protein TVP23 [Spathaspora passalidarum NRRL Y-27907]
MSSAYTAIEADEPINQTPYSQPQHTYTTSPPANTTPAPTTAPAQGQQTTNNVPETWVERIRQSSHPIALLFYMFFRLAPIFIYIFGNFFIGFFTTQNRFILHFITLILLVSADFWNLKNISGRLLVGLRWWNETNPIEGQVGEFENVWVFETADPNRYINPIDSKMFWLLLYGQPIAWGVLGLLAVLKFQFLYLMLIAISISLSVTNALAFTKCDKFGKANSFANDLFSRATGSMFSRLNPFGGR